MKLTPKVNYVQNVPQCHKALWNWMCKSSQSYKINWKATVWPRLKLPKTFLGKLISLFLYSSLQILSVVNSYVW